MVGDINCETLHEVFIAVCRLVGRVQAASCKV